VLARFGGPEVLCLETVPEPEPGPGEVVVAVEVAGVNFGDTMIRRGEYLRDQPLSMAPGCEAVGRVVAVGEGVEVPLCTRVAAWIEAGGAYADRVVVEAERAFPVPTDLPAEAIAAIFLQGTTAHYALHRYGRTAAGETVLVHAAAGGVGSLAVQLAALAGARVIGTASSPAKREATLELGADVALDSSRPEKLAAAIRAATDGHGADVIVDGVGGPLFAPSLGALAFNGRYVIAGAASQEPSPLDARRLLVRGQTICGFMLVRVIEQDAREPARTISLLCELLRESALRPRVESLPLEEAAEAHRRLDAREVTGKLVLATSPNGRAA
jgi:NADPH2:quinone reductase